MPSIVVLENKPDSANLLIKISSYPNCLNLTGVDDNYDLRYQTFQVLNGFKEISVKTKLVKEEMHRLLFGEDKIPQLHQNQAPY